MKLPDPYAMGPGPQRSGRPMASIDLTPIAEGEQAAAQAYIHGGSVLADAVGAGGEAYARALAREAEIGRAVGQGGDQIGDAVRRVGEAAGRATERTAAQQGGAVTEAGQAMGRSVARAGAEEGRVISQGGEAMGTATARAGAQQAAVLANSGEAFGAATARAGQRQGQAVTEAGQMLGGAEMRAGQQLSQSVERVGNAAASSERETTGNMGNAVIRGGDAIANAIRRGADMEQRAAAQLGHGIEQFGTGLYHYAESEFRMDLARAKAKFTSGQTILDAQYDRDTDRETVKERYQKDLDALRESSAASIRSPGLRERFMVATQDDVARGQVRVDRHAYKLETFEGLAELDTDLKNFSKAALIRKEEDRGEIIARGTERIEEAQRAGYLTPLEAYKTKKQWVENYAQSTLWGMDPAERERKLTRGPTSLDEYADRTIGVESGGKASAKNARSSATGAGQFIDQTWLEVLKKGGPEQIASQIEFDGKKYSVADKQAEKTILDLRGDKALSREMVKAYAQQNADYLKSQHIEPTYDHLYLAHFLGPQTAAAVLKADPNTPVADIVGKKAVEANPEVLGGKTAGSLAAWAGQKIGTGPTGGVVDFLEEPTRVDMLAKTRQQLQQIQTVQSAERSEQFERMIIDAGAGVGSLPERGAIETDPALTDARRNTLLRAYDKAAGDVTYFKNAMARFNEPKGAPFDPFDNDERGAVDKIYKALGGNPAALQRVVDRTGMVPETVAASLRADIASNDPKRVATSSAVARNLLAQNPTIFTGIKGASDMENAAVTFSHYVDDLGFTAEQAASRIVESNSPEYQAKVKAKIKSEDVDKIIKDKLKPSDLGSAFNQGIPLIGRPGVEFSPELRGAAMSNYGELFKERYLETGDVALAKTQAVEQLKKVWGVTYVTGSVGGVVMRYPPERAPVYANIPDASTRIAMQAQESIKAETGQDIDRKKIILSPTAGGQTARAYQAGEAVPYSLSWFDKSGVLHTLNPGRAFVPDPKAMRETVTDQRAAAFEQGAAAAAPALDARETRSATQQRLKDERRERIDATRREVESAISSEGGSDGPPVKIDTSRRVDVRRLSDSVDELVRGDPDNPLVALKDALGGKRTVSTDDIIGAVLSMEGTPQIMGLRGLGDLLQSLGLAGPRERPTGRQRDLST